MIRPGDRVFFEPGEKHWHGAAPGRFMTHLAMLEVDDKGEARDVGRPGERRGVRRRAAYLRLSNADEPEGRFDEVRPRGDETG